MARPVKNMAVSRVKSLPPLRCTEAEYALVQGNAQAAGMSVSSYMRQMVVQGKVVRKGNSAPSSELLLQLMRTGSDLQRLRDSMEQRGVVVPQDLQTCLQRMDAVLQEVL
jgi:hypothetical protein